MARVLLIGGTGNISYHTLRELAARGDEVGVLNRGRFQPEGEVPGAVRHWQGDRDREDDVRQTIDAFRPEVVMDFVCFRPDQAEQAIAVCRGRIQHYVFVSTVDAYGYPLSECPMPAGGALREPVGAYAQAKRQCEDLFWAAHHAGAFAVTITRPTYCLGRTFVASFFSHNATAVLKRMAQRRPVAIPGDGSGRMHPGTGRDCGRMHARLVGDERAWGRAFNCGSAGTAMSQLEYYEMLGRVMGVQPECVPAPRPMLEERFGSRLDGIYRNVMQFDLEFGFDEFRELNPDFEWERGLETGVRQFLDRVRAEGTWDAESGSSVDDQIADAFSAGAVTR